MRYVLLAAFCVSVISTSNAHAQIKVVVTSKPAQSLVASVMGETGIPGVLVSGAASPHTYAMKPSDGQAVNRATVFFRISEGLEPFTKKLAKSLPKSVRLVSLQETPGLNVVDRREGGAFEAHGHDDHKADAQGGGTKAGKRAAEAEDETDPHVWLDPRNAILMIDYIATVLGEADPANASTYKSNAATAKSKLQALDQEMERELKPYAGKAFIVLHDAYQYFERRFGLTAVGSIAVNPETAPSGKRLSALRKKIADAGVACVFAEPGMQPKVVAAVIEGSSAKSVLQDPEATRLSPGPNLYEDLMRGLVNGVKQCFDPK